MTALEIVFLVLLTLTIVTLLFYLLFLLIYIKMAKREKRIAKIRAKGAKRKRKLARKRKYLRVQKKKNQHRAIFFFSLALVLFGSSKFVSYYQSMTLSSKDEDVIVKSYFLLNDFEAELEKAKDKSQSREIVDSNIRYLASAITSYSANKANSLNTEEGQLTLNRYYKTLLDIGTNAMRMTDGFYGNEELITGYQSDIKRVKGYQKKVFELYKIDEAALKKAKSTS